MKTATEEFISAIGQASVVSDEGQIAEAETATFATEQRIQLILRPATTLDVQNCLRVAHKHRIPVYPSSTGKNWGYGSRVPVGDNNVLIDLGRLNEIHEVNESLAYVAVGAGVTQRQLFDYLKEKHDNRLWLDSTSSTPHSSLIGNLLERGHGVTPLADHSANACNFEVVLADGTIVNTGYGAFPGCVNAPLDPCGLGPSFDGLFSQSNYGIVTKATIWLYPAPEMVQLAILSIQKADVLVKAIDSLRSLRLRGSLRAGPNFSNDSFLMSRRVARPGRLSNLRGCDLGRELSAIANERGLPAWRGMVPFYGTREEVRVLREQVQTVLESIQSEECQTDYLDEASLASRADLSDEKRSDLQNTLNHFMGRLTGYGLPRAYWRSDERAPKDTSDINLDADRCGISTVSVTGPHDGEHIVKLTRLVKEIMLSFGFDPHISFSCVRTRNVQMNAFICFNRNIQSEEDSAGRCRHEVLRSVTSRGYFPNRLDISSMHVMASATPGCVELAGRLKAAVDPHNILAPGRYSARTKTL